MEILGIENVSFVDFEGKICATIFTGGCNYNCRFCHNSGIAKNIYERIDENKILNYLQSRKNLLDGVTISGGEPTLQRDLKEFIIKIKNMGYQIKLDTNGTNPKLLKELIEENLIDYVAMDIKNNFDNYSEICGVQNTLVENVKESLKILSNSEIKYELRTTLIKEYHTKSNIEQMAKELENEPNLYLQKFKESENCFDTNLHEVPLNEAQEFQQILKQRIKEVKLRGYT